MNDRICKRRELIVKKEGKFYTNTKDFQDRIKAMPFEAGQNVWLQNFDSRKCEEAVICEKCREPNSYMVEIPATGQCFRRNSNFIKPRQSEKNSSSTTLQSNITVPVVPQEPPAFQRAVPSSPATSTVDALLTVPPVLQNKNSTPRQPRTSSRDYQRNSTLKAWTTSSRKLILRVQTYRHSRQSYFRKGDVAIWVRMTLSVK